MTVDWIDPAVSHPPDTHSVLVTYVADGARFVSLGWFSPGGKWLSEFGDELEVVAWAKLPPPAGVAKSAMQELLTPKILVDLDAYRNGRFRP